MNRARFVFAATLAGASLVGVSVFAQTPPQAPEMKSVLAGKKFSDTQPFGKAVVRTALFDDSSTFVLLNVMTLASQQIASVPVGDGGENPGTLTTVCSSRLYCVSRMSSHAPLARKLLSNSLVTLFWAL